MLAVIVLSLVTVGVITFLKPVKYLSVTTAVAASSYTSDKARIFNENIQGLYSTLGSSDDLDRIVGTGSLDTVYLFMAEKFSLAKHYKIKGSASKAQTKAALELKENTKVYKSEYGELKVKVWDTDKNLAPQLANAVMDKLHSMHNNIQAAGNEASLNALKKTRLELQAAVDSLLVSPESTAAATERIKEYDKLIAQYQLVVDNKPPVLVIVEKARPSMRPDKPKRMQIMLATAVLSFLFALLAAVVMERRKNSSA